MSLKVVKVDWIDSETDHGWIAIKDISDSLPLAQTYGVLVKETKTFIVIANSVDQTNENCNGRITIPRSAIKTIQEIDLLKG